MFVSTSAGVDIEIITAHFKSKLLTFPGGRFSPHDEAERGRFAAARRQQVLVDVDSAGLSGAVNKPTNCFEIAAH
jgi:hypothetical protein